MLSSANFLCGFLPFTAWGLVSPAVQNTQVSDHARLSFHRVPSKPGFRWATVIQSRRFQGYGYSFRSHKTLANYHLPLCMEVLSKAVDVNATLS